MPSKIAERKCGKDEDLLECHINSEIDNVEQFISELQMFLGCLNLQSCHRMEDEVKCVSSKKHERLVRPAELPLSADQTSRFSSGTVYSPVTELSMNLGDLSTDTGISGFTFIKPIDPPRLDETPKRKPSIVSPTPLKPVLQKQLSFESGSSDESSAALSDSFKSKFGTLLKDSNSSERSYSKRSECRSSAYARFKAMPSPFCGFGSSPSTSCPPESVEDKENVSPAKCLFRNADRIRCSSPLAEAKTTFVVGADDTNSQDSGVGLDLPSKSQDGFKFPIAPAPRRHRVFSDDAINSPLKYSPVKERPTFKGKLSLLSPSPSPKRSSHKMSPVKLRRSSLTCSPVDDEGDEGFLELKDIDNDGLESGAPSGLDKLINAPVLNTSIPTDSSDETGETPNKHKCVRRLQSQLDDSFEIKQRPSSIRRGLFRSPSDPLGGGIYRSKSFAYGASPSLDSSVFSPSCSPMFTLNKKTISPRRCSSKRSEPCNDEEFTPLRLCKRRKSVIESPKVDSPAKCRLRRSHSEAEIKHAVNQAASQPDLIGDCSKEYCLPTIQGCHADLKSISHETMAKLLRGEYDHVVEKYIVVDARYPYEYEGGHIRGATNIYARDVLLKNFLQSSEHKDYICKDSSKRQIVIFHCEFSKNRGPNMSRFLREQDRKVSSYPSLHYPEIYLLDKGYKEFYYNQKNLCEPLTYTPMLHENHTDDLKKFRLKSKSWAGEQRSRHGLRTGLKF